MRRLNGLSDSQEAQRIKRMEKLTPVERATFERLSKMPVPDGCQMNIIKCKKCKQLQCWVFIADRYYEEPPGYFYDPCKCLLDMSAGRTEGPSWGNGTLMMDIVTWDEAEPDEYERLT